MAARTQRPQLRIPLKPRKSGYFAIFLITISSSFHACVFPQFTSFLFHTRNGHTMVASSTNGQRSSTNHDRCASYIQVKLKRAFRFKVGNWSAIGQCGRHVRDDKLKAMQNKDHEKPRWWNVEEASNEKMKAINDYTSAIIDKAYPQLIEGKRQKSNAEAVNYKHQA